MGGDIHFDDDEMWVDGIENKEGTQFFAVALHELGHSLGLAHTPVESSVMFPYYKLPESGGTPQLGYDDILGMYDLYIRRVLKEDLQPTKNTIHDEHTTTRRRSTTSTTTTRRSTTRKTQKTTKSSRPKKSSTTRTPSSHKPRKTTEHKEWNYPTKPTITSTFTYEGDFEFVEEHKNHDGRHNTTNNIAPDIPDICDGRLDAVATLRDELFVFRGQYVWRYKEKRRLEKGYPVKLHDMFPKLPKSITKIDAAYQRPDGMIVIFTGNVFWVYDGSNFLESSPQSLTYYGLPDYLTSIDAVQNWKKNKKTYFFKNERFWRYNETSHTMDDGYPLTMKRWRGVPDDLDAATTWKDGVTYFFRGGLFWKFDNDWVMVTDESPLPTPQVWFGCAENSNKIINWFLKEDS
nr:matrix metalloproteinase-2-like [Leptinotarsa decemlineata]